MSTSRSGVVSGRVSPDRYIVAGQVNLWPKGFNLTTFDKVFGDERFQASARNVLVVLLFVPIEVFVAGLLAADSEQFEQQVRHA